MNFSCVKFTFLLHFLLFYLFKPMKCPRHINTLPSSCYCIAAKLELITWMGTFRDKSSFDNFMPQGYKVRIKDHDMCVRASTMVSSY